MSPALALAAAFGAAAAGATVLGGLLALLCPRARPALLSFGAGVVLGVALLDLFPEALTLGEGVIRPDVTCATVLAGYLIYLVLGQGWDLGDATGQHRSSQLVVASLAVHSLLDGFGIGCAFQAAASIGLTVACGVVAHDMVDGSNTVVFSLDGRASSSIALRWLLVDGTAPIAGILLSGLARAPPEAASSVLALMAGGFVHLGGRYLARGARSGEPARSVGLAGAGLLFVLLVVRFAER
jgi:zinc transporter ZupT